MRRLLRRDAMAPIVPLLALALALVVVAIVLFGLGHDFGAVTALIAAFLAVGGAKRAR